MYTATLTQQLGFNAADLPALSRASNTANNSSGWIVGPVDMSLFKRVMGKASFSGTQGAGCTATISFLCANTSNTSCCGSWLPVTGGPSLSVTANTFPSLAIEMRSEQMNAGTRYLALLVQNQCTVVFNAEVICDSGVQLPVSNNNVNTTFLVTSVM